MTCENCGGTGIFLPQPHDTLGMPNGWVQKCDSCDKYEDDWEAMNAHRKSLGMKPMRDYPFGLVDRDDASPDNPLEQQFYIRGHFEDRNPVEAVVGLMNDGNGLFTIADLEESLVANFQNWLYAAGEWRVGYPNPPLKRVEVYDCGPVKQQNCEMEIVPVIYEIDSYGEATGTVHFFCSEVCRDRMELSPPSNYAAGYNHRSDIPDGNVCESCLNLIGGPDNHV